MKIRTALILCAGFGKRLNPITLKTPKPLLKLSNITLLESCINLIIKFGIKKIFLNTFYLEEQISNFVEGKNFPCEINIIKDGDEILDTGGGILSMISHSQDNDFLIFNPDTLWSEKNLDEIVKMQNFYFAKNLNNLLLVTRRDLSFDKNLTGDFKLENNLLKKTNDSNFIFIGCQILSKDLFKNFKISNFSVSEIWNELLKKNKLNGFESLNEFYHLTNLEIFKKLKDL